MCILVYKKKYVNAKITSNICFITIWNSINYSIPSNTYAPKITNETIMKEYQYIIIKLKHKIKMQFIES